MDLDPMESATSAREERNALEDAATARLSTWVAITVALLATFLGICQIKDDNIVQAMQRAQADMIDHWSYYQARNIREEVANAALVQLRLSAAAAPAAMQPQYQVAIDAYQKLATDQATKKEAIRLQAEEDQRIYDALNFRDDQFDLCEAFIALAISILALTALTHKQWLYFIALIPTTLGIVVGVAGLMEWRLHSQFISALLS